jgi:CO dehydrogenase nickel-insertion accessory protein CooC1
MLDRLPMPYFSRSEEGIILMTAGKIGGLGVGAGCDGPIAKIARDLKVHLLEDEEPVMLVDFKAGFEDTARGVITGLDWILAVVDPTTAGIEMVNHLRKTVLQVQTGASPATAHIEDPALAELAERLYRETRMRGMLAVLNRVTDEETEAYLRNKLLEEDISPVAVIPHHKEFSTAWLHGKRLPAHLVTEEAEAIARGLEVSERENRFTAGRTVPS